MTTVIGLCWIVLVAVVTLRWVDDRLVVAVALAQRRRSRRSSPAGRSLAAAPLRVLGSTAFVTVGRALRARVIARRDHAAGAAALPLAVELVAVGAGAGASPLQALAVAAQWSPPPVAAALDGIGRSVALGASFDEALAVAARRDTVLVPLVDVVRPAVRVGAPLGAVLQTLAADLRAEQARLATARARRVSVSLIFPLVLLVLPAFALLTVVPALVAGWRSV